MTYSVAEIPAQVEATLTPFFSARHEMTETIDPAFAGATATLREFVLGGGKRLRPTFAWLGWLGAQPEGTDPGPGATTPVLRAASSLELVQACALIHDDIIDRSAMRRGHPTVHVQFTGMHRRAGWAGSSEAFGEASAILLGDLALAWSDDLLRDAGLTAAEQFALAPVWAAMRTEVLGGQYLDIRAEATGDESLESALQIDRFKTAAYTVARPLQFGGAIADASDELMAAYEDIGTDLGIAFQLRDDVLGVFGDPARTGKPSGDDLRTGKRTALLAMALRRADAADPAAARLLRTSVGTDLDDAAVDRLRGVLRELGALDEVETRMGELIEASTARLQELPLHPQAKSELIGLAHLVSARVA